MSLGTVNRLRKEGSESLSAAVAEAEADIQAAPIVGADETGFVQGNADELSSPVQKSLVVGGCHPLD